MKNILYVIYGISPRVIRQLIRSVIAVVRKFNGQSNISYEQYTRSKEATRLPIYDNNVAVNDSLACPLCGASELIFSYADLTRVENGTAIRKIFHTCEDCGFLFTNEKRSDREDFFENTPYIEDQKGLRAGREVDLVELFVGVNGLDKSSNILIYAIGKGNTLDLLQERGYSNVWGADVSNGVNYGGRLVDVSDQSDYFSRNNIRFDIIVAVEVWEHYAWDEIDNAFAWQFEQLSTKGILVGTTSLWSPESGNEFFRGKFESGIEFLKLWHYPFFIDHTSLYSEKALQRLSQKYGMNVQFAYFDKPYVQIMDPGKRIIFMTKKFNTKMVEYVDNNYSRNFLRISH